MKLHNDKQVISNTILSVSIELNIIPALTEKDYYVTLFKNIKRLYLQGCIKGGAGKKFVLLREKGGLKTFVARYEKDII